MFSTIVALSNSATVGIVLLCVALGLVHAIVDRLVPLNLVVGLFHSFDEKQALRQVRPVH